MAAIEFPEELNLCVEYVDRNVREGRGDEVAILYGDERYTYREVLENVCRAANLLERIGLQREQRVLLCLSDHPEFVYFWFAAVRMGAVVSACNPFSTAEELDRYLRYSRSRVVVAEERLLGTTLRPEASEWVRHVIVCRGDGARGDLGPNRTRWEDVRDGLPPDHTPARTLAEDVGVMLYTGGSTGHPKAAVHRHVDFLYNTHTYGLPVLGFRPGDVAVTSSKLYFGYALGTNLLFPFRAGATVALFPDKPTPERVLDEVTKRRATILSSVPTTINGLTKLELDRDRWDWSSLRITTSAGEALPVELHKAYTERFGHELLDGIGSAEFFHCYITNRPGDVVPGSLGRVVEGYEAKICDEDGVELPDGELGSLWIRGESMALGYFMQTEATRQAFRGPWFVSADKFCRDAEGRFWYGGRADDLIKVAGRWLAPLEVENVLLGHPAVADAAVTGFLDEAGLTKPRAYVVVRDKAAIGDALVEDLRAFVGARLSAWKCPREYVFRDSLPRSDRGKLLRRALQ